MSTASVPTSRQEEILDRALELIRESGLGGITMKKVAERVGFTEPAVYRHFPTKQALLLGIVERLSGMLLGPVRELAARRDLPPAERLERIVSHHIRLIVETDGLPILLLAESTSSGDEALAGRMTQVAGAYLEVVSGVVGELRLPPEAPSPRTVVLPLLGIAAAVALQRRLMPETALSLDEALGLVRFHVRCITALCPEEVA
jgi:AcrR family transcriptional regulator